MKGILFTEEMFVAVVERRKTKTRRVMKPQPVAADAELPMKLLDYTNRLDSLRKEGYKLLLTIGDIQ